MMTHIRKHYISFKNAWRGLCVAVTYHPNFKIHIALSAFVLAACYYFKLSNFENIIIIFTIVLGFAAEMINTSIEYMTDLITKEWREDARIAKDVSAGMMLVVSVGALVVAGIIFVPRIFAMLR